MNTTIINITISRPNMLASWDGVNQEASQERYRTQLTEALASVYPDADIEVRFTDAIAGTVYRLDGEADEPSVRDIVDRTYESFDWIVNA